MDTEQEFIIAAEILGFEARYDEDANTVIANRDGGGTVSFHFTRRPAMSADSRLRQWVSALQRTKALDGLTFEQARPLLERELADH